jgi:hypothetical protein
MKRPHLLVVTFLLWLAYIMATFPIMRDTLSFAESCALWIISEPPSQQIMPFALRAAANAALDSLREAYARTRGEAQFVLYYPLLNIWQTFMGQSVFASRLASAWFTLLAFAAVYALFKRAYSQRTTWGVLGFLAAWGFTYTFPRHISPHSMVFAALVIAILVISALGPLRFGGSKRFLSRRRLAILTLFAFFLCCAPLAMPQYRPYPDAALITDAAHTRQATEPAITLIDPRSRVAYYARARELITGISLDLSWRAFTADEVRGYVAQLADAPSLWIIMPEGSDLTAAAIAASVSSGYSIGYEAYSDGILIYRFDKPT